MKERMDKKENLRRTFRGEPHDWIPASFFLHLKQEQLGEKECTQFHLEFYEKTDVDFIKVMHDGLISPCTLSPKGLWELKEYRPGREKNPYIHSYLERVKLVCDGLSGNVDVFANIFSPFTLLRRIGEEKIHYYIQEDHRAVRDVLLWMAEDIGWMAEQMIKAGCLGNFLAFQGAEKNLFSLEEYEQIIKASDLKVLDMANEASAFNILHFCGWNQVKNNLELWREYPGCVVNWATYVEEMDLEEGWRYFGMRPVLGGFDNRKHGILYGGSKELVEEETRRIVTKYKESVGNVDSLILGADCSFLPDFKEERFRWVLNEVRREPCGMGERKGDKNG